MSLQRRFMRHQCCYAWVIQANRPSPTPATASRLVPPPKTLAAATSTSIPVMSGKRKSDSTTSKPPPSTPSTDRPGPSGCGSPSSPTSAGSCATPGSSSSDWPAGCLRPYSDQPDGACWPWPGRPADRHSPPPSALHPPHAELAGPLAAASTPRGVTEAISLREPTRREHTANPVLRRDAEITQRRPIAYVYSRIREFVVRLTMLSNQVHLTKTREVARVGRPRICLRASNRSAERSWDLRKVLPSRPDA